jgi:putative transposase
MTLPVCYSWFPVGERLCVPYEAPQGRRVNAIGGYFSHGPMAGKLVYRTFAQLPPHARKAKRKSADEVARSYGLALEEVGSIDADRFVAFLWHLAGRPEGAPTDWKRERPLVIKIDNYSVHKSQTVKTAVPALERADVFLTYLPSYCPQLSEIEPIWNDVKHHHLPKRSHSEVAELKAAVDRGLRDKAHQLLQANRKTANFEHIST